MAKPPKPKSDNKSKDEKVKAPKTFAPKRQMEEDHKAGHHKESVGNCEYCNRRNSRDVKKAQATKRFFAGAKS